MHFPCFFVFLQSQNLQIMKKILFIALLAAVLVSACGSSDKPEKEAGEPVNTHQNIPGDSARYGLACDGCTDSIIVLLPFSGEDPDTFDIIDAWQQHRVYGHPRIGDELAIVLNPEDPGEALMVINLETLANTWCYMVTPTLRNVENMPPRMQRRMLNDMRNLPDSLRKLWLTPREYSLQLKSDHTAMVRGGMRSQTTTDDMSPIEFPTPHRYTEWHLYNGRLILHADTIGGFSRKDEVPFTDTATIIMLHEDTLVLRIADTEQGYYCKP